MPKNLLLQKRTTLLNRSYKLLHKHRNLRKKQRPYSRLHLSAVVGSYMMKKWDIRQEAFSKMSDFSQESFSGIAVIKAFVKEAK